MKRVTSLCSPRSGNPVANQHVITTEKGEYFQSYQTVIAFRPKEGSPILSSWYKYSKTTMKYLCVFLGLDNIKEVESKKYKVVETIAIE